MADPIIPPSPQFLAITNDPLAVAALIEAELNRPGRTIIELGPAPEEIVNCQLSIDNCQLSPPTPFRKMPAAKRAAIREMIARIKNDYYGGEGL